LSEHQRAGTQWLLEMTHIVHESILCVHIVDYASATVFIKESYYYYYYYY